MDKNFTSVLDCGSSNLIQRCEEAYKLVDNYINGKTVDYYKYGEDYRFDKDRRERTLKAIFKSLKVLEGLFQKQK